MGLENTFEEVKKLPKEKKLEVITSKEAIIKDLEDYFERTKFGGWRIIEEREKYFGFCMEFLQSFELNPEMISEFNTKIGNIEEDTSFGPYLSAMIQTSYNQEFNDFTFDTINTDCFGAFLKGQPEKPIKITTKKINGLYSLYDSKNCSLTAETIKGNWILECAKNCKLIVKTLKGDENLFSANYCFAEITNYQGICFGWYMENCTIKSGDEETLELLEKQADIEGNNKFELKK